MVTSLRRGGITGTYTLGIIYIFDACILHNAQALFCNQKKNQ